MKLPALRSKHPKKAETRDLRGFVQRSLIGNECILSTNKMNPLLLESPEQNWEGKPVVFSSKDKGENQIAKSLHTKGIYDQEIAGINMLYDYPVVIFAVYTSLTAPFLKIFGCDNFSFEISSPTSTGKTITLKIAASCWGNAHECSGGLFRTWKTTKTAIERAAQALNGIPLILDDTKNAPGHDKFSKSATPIVTDSIYMIASGVGKSRGTLFGTDENQSFSTIMMSTGESPSIDMTNDAGSRGRIISLWGAPFKKQSQELNRFVSEIDGIFKNNYGHMGIRLVSFILNNEKNWNLWREAYNEVKDKLVERCRHNSVQMRICQDIAAIVTAIPIIHAAMPELKRDFSLKTLIGEILDLAMTETIIEDNGIRFLKSLSENLMENKQLIWTREKNDKKSMLDPSPLTMYSDYDGSNWTFIGIKSNVLRQIINENNMHQSEVLRILKSKGDLQLTGNTDSYQKRVIIPRRDGSSLSTNLYCIKREALESLSIFSW